MLASPPTWQNWKKKTSAHNFILGTGKKEKKEKRELHFYINYILI